MIQTTLLDLPEAVIVLTMTALIPFTATVLSSVSGVTGAAGDGVTGGGWEDVGVAVGGATAAATIIHQYIKQKFIVQNKIHENLTL
jgi:hypothetical protein